MPLAVTAWFVNESTGFTAVCGAALAGAGTWSAPLPIATTINVRQEIARAIPTILLLLFRECACPKQIPAQHAALALPRSANDLMEAAGRYTRAAGKASQRMS
jgi:hypothetical protein